MKVGRYPCRRAAFRNGRQFGALPGASHELVLEKLLDTLLLHRAGARRRVAGGHLAEEIEERLCESAGGGNPQAS